MSAPGEYLLTDNLAAQLEIAAIGALGRHHTMPETTRHFALATLALVKDRADRVELANHTAAEVSRTMVFKCSNPDCLCRKR
jgi:hypothetical protein